MITFKFYLDCRKLTMDGRGSLKIVLRNEGKQKMLPLRFYLKPELWIDETQSVRRSPCSAQYNTFIHDVRRNVEDVIFELREKRIGSLELAVNALRVALYDDNAPFFCRRMEQYATAAATAGTRGLYLQTLGRIRAFSSTADLLKFEDITVDWLRRFEAFLARTANKNARNIHLRNIRAVFNAAIDDEVTSAYPFRRFKIKPVATPKRSLTVERLRELLAYPVEEWQRKYVDLFLLIFCLIGINVVDLCRLKMITAEGRIEYYRAKTHRLYSVKVEPEARAIIDKYVGKDWLLDILDVYGNYKDFGKRMNRALQSIGECTRSGLGGKKHITPAFPGITTYWARHSWATIAASLDIPKETIAHALGHGGNTITDIYINFDQSKVDEANRRVLDWVLYSKR